MTAAPRVGVVRVWILPSDAWAGTGWTEEPRLIPVGSTDLPSAKGSASFRLLRSVRDDTGSGYTSAPGLVIPGHWVAITYGVDAFSFAAVRWWGFIKRISGPRFEGGDIAGNCEALQVGHLMDESGLIGWQCSTGTGSIYEIEDAPTWNMNHKGGEVVGNIVDVSSVAVFARASDMGASPSARIGSRLELLLHVVTYCKPESLPAMRVESGAAAAILDDITSPEVIDVREATFCGAIDLCATRSRSVAWTIVPENAGWVVSCWLDPAATGTNIDLSGYDESEVTVDETEAAVDEVVVEGAPIIFCGSVSPQDSNLDQAWTSAQETEWKTAVTQDGGEKLTDYVERVAAFRSKAALSSVFTRFKVPDTNGALTRSLDPGDGSTAAKFFPRIEWDGSSVSLSASDTVDPYWPTTELLRWVPVRVDGGDDPQAQWSKPMVFRRDEAADAAVDGPVWVDLAVDWKKRHGAQIDVGDHGPTLGVKFGPPEILAKGHWTGSPAPAKLDGMGFITPETSAPPSHPRCLDWQNIVATIAIPSGQRLRVVKRYPGYDAADVRRRLKIRDEKLQLWVLHQGTILDIGDGGTVVVQASTEYPRNDYMTAERIATEAAAWSFRDRSAVTIELPLSALPSFAVLGFAVGDVIDGPTTYVANTCIGSIIIDWSIRSPRITVSTVFPERPSGSGGGSASPSGGGSVSANLGGTVAQATRGASAAVASVIQAAQNVPLIQARQRASVDPGPLFWTVSQASHGLSVNNVIRHNGTIWIKSQADTAANAVVGGIVIAVISTGVFVMASAGYVSGLSGLTAGSVHYLDAATAGALTTTAPSIQCPIIHADTATSGTLLSMWAGGGGVIHVATTNPTATDDSSAGYVLGTVWINTASDAYFIAVDVTPGAAVWAASIGSGAACTVLGRSANSTGVRADIAAATNGTVLTRIGDAVQFLRDLILGTTANAGSLTIANATSATAIVLSPTLVNAAGKVIAVREIDVCDAGTAKKMLVVGSAPY